MKITLTTILIGIYFFGFSKDKIHEGKGVFNQVTVVSDAEDLKIPKGKCLIFGKVYYEVEKEPNTSEFILCNENHSSFFKTDKNKFKKINANGSFEMTADTAVQFFLFKEKLSETEISLLEEIYFENYVFKSQHKIEIAVYLPLKSKKYGITVDKPVIYAYSEKAVDFIIHLKPQGELSFTYPKIQTDNSWKMKTSSQGILTDQNGLEYPYLFWESRQNFSEISQKNAQSNEIIAGVDLIEYFEKQLSNLGLNAKEKTDFITYWCPKFIHEKNIQIQFFVDEDCSIIGELEISPKPENLRRIYVTFLKNPINVSDFVPKTLQYKPLKRNGFTIIEWGGSELKNLEF